MRIKCFKGALLSALVMASLITPLLLLSPSPVHAALIPHAPIYINGNAGFTKPDPVNGGGSGTLGDPYIIENYIIDASTAYGVYIRNTTAHFVVRNCVVENGGSAYYGILLFNVVNGRVENNACENNRDGIHLRHSNNNALTNNTCEKNQSTGILLLDSDNNTLANNICGNNRWNGIYLYSSSNNTLSNNICVNNSFRGIDLYSSDNNTISSNTCENNGQYGIHLILSDNNTISHNNLKNNANQAYDSSTNTWDDRYPSGGNYWSDYTGVDDYKGENQDIPGSDGIGDTPYPILGGANQDRYPLMNPWPPPPPAPPVGGIVRPVNKLALLAPWIILAALIAIAAVSVAVYWRRR